MKVVLSLIFGFVVVFASVLGNQYADDVSAAFDLSPLDYLRPLSYFLLMVAGSLASERYNYFSNNPNAGKGFFKNISYSYVYRSLLVSPITFGVVVTFIGRDANFLMAAIFSFQNGFFWETIFGGLRKSPASLGLPEIGTAEKIEKQKEPSS